ncbi:MAG: thiamine pyrophosphate-binding protein [SAR202 cluster bacterium]|nr:thiamine pyrophosphate-binding protein [SAR202 cluster bacterium]
MPRMTGKRALVEMLRAEGVKYVFGNPGTTELPFIDAIQDAKDIKYINTLFEGVGAGMADGLARVTQKPSYMSFHISVGVTNSIAVMYNSWRGGTPMVITAGQASAQLLNHSPTLWSNMVNVMKEYTKWAGEVTTPQDVAPIIRRAFKVASTPPTGPVFVDFAWESLNGEADVDINPSIGGYYRVRPDKDALQAAARKLAGAKKPLMLIGDRVSQSPGAPYEVAKIAARLGAPIFATSFSEVHVPASDPHYLGAFDTSWLPLSLKRRFDEADAILAIGTDVLITTMITPEPPFSGKPKIIHLDCDDWAIQRSYPVAGAVLGDIKTSLEELGLALDDIMTGAAKSAAGERNKAVAEEKRRRKEAFQARVKASWNNRPMSPERWAHEMSKVIAPDVLVCDDSITNRGPLLQAVDFDKPGTLVGGRGGSLGFGMGATMGMKLAAPDKAVLGVIGDGTAMFAIQALWTGVEYNIPVTWVFCNNRSYKVLRENMVKYLVGTERQSEFIGMNFYENPLDFVKLGNAFGVEGIRVEDPEKLAPAVRKALDSGKPYVVDAIIDDKFDERKYAEDWGQWWVGRSKAGG